MEQEVYVYSFKFYNNKCYALAESKIIGNPEYKLIGTTTLQIEEEKKEVEHEARVGKSHLNCSISEYVPLDACDIKVVFKVKEQPLVGWIELVI